MPITFTPDFTPEEYDAYEAAMDDIQVVYLSGPIGLPQSPEEYARLYQRMLYAAYVQGAIIATHPYHVVINPYAAVCYTPNFADVSREQWVAQGVYLAGVTCNIICMLPGWEDSDGCAQELAAAAAAEKRLYTWDDIRGMVKLQRGDA